jgi:hypothetical protein
MARFGSPAERTTAEALMAIPSSGSDGSTIRRKSWASASARPPAPSQPSRAGRAGHKAATISDVTAAENTVACVESRRPRAKSRAPSAGATSAATAIDMPMRAEIVKNRMALA